MKHGKQSLTIPAHLIVCRSSCSKKSSPSCSKSPAASNRAHLCTFSRSSQLTVPLAITSRCLYRSSSLWHLCTLSAGLACCGATRSAAPGHACTCPSAASAELTCTACTTATQAYSAVSLSLVFSKEYTVDCEQTIACFRTVQSPELLLRKPSTKLIAVTVI